MGLCNLGLNDCFHFCPINIYVHIFAITKLFRTQLFSCNIGVGYAMISALN